MLLFPEGSIPYGTNFLVDLFLFIMSIVHREHLCALISVIKAILDVCSIEYISKSNCRSESVFRRPRFNKFEN